jgi:hypothetical protein
LAIDYTVYSTAGYFPHAGRVAVLIDKGVTDPGERQDSSIARDTGQLMSALQLGERLKLGETAPG